MADPVDFLVVREHIGFKEGDTRSADPAEVQHLIPNVLTPKGAKAEKAAEAVENKAEDALLNKAEPAPDNKAAAAKTASAKAPAKKA